MRGWIWSFIWLKKKTWTRCLFMHVNLKLTRTKLGVHKTSITPKYTSSNLQWNLAILGMWMWRILGTNFKGNQGWFWKLILELFHWPQRKHSECVFVVTIKTLVLAQKWVSKINPLLPNGSFIGEFSSNPYQSQGVCYT
jgi:hypothetical protein